MSAPAIKVEGLSKCYRLGSIGRHTLVDEAQHLWCKLRGKDPRAVLGKVGESAVPMQSDKEFWALKDISFAVQAGEVLGVIGGNGAGKSTLLKILSRITEPTHGTATICGRVGSLLEVGTGFHPELTGRENVFMNGTILGMRKREVSAKFDEIVAFSGIEKFIDTPVKRYSSGMYVRLAFAVAAHLEPEILIVDEVLAVGDAEFQKRCLGKMGEVAKEGRTVLFVSHNMAAVQQLCNRGIVLHHGEVLCSEAIQKTIGYYFEHVISPDQDQSLAKRTRRQGSGWLTFQNFQVLNDQGRVIGSVMTGKTLNLRLWYASQRELAQANVQVAFNIKTSQGYLITNLNAEDTGGSQMSIGKQGYFECICPDFPLRSGRYLCTIFCSVNGEIVDWVQNAFRLEVTDGDFHRTGKLIGRDQGDLLIHHQWATRITSPDETYSAEDPL